MFDEKWLIKFQRISNLWKRLHPDPTLWLFIYIHIHSYFFFFTYSQKDVIIITFDSEKNVLLCDGGAIALFYLISVTLRLLYEMYADWCRQCVNKTYLRFFLFFSGERENGSLCVFLYCDSFSSISFISRVFYGFCCCCFYFLSLFLLLLPFRFVFITYSFIIYYYGSWYLMYLVQQFEKEKNGNRASINIKNARCNFFVVRISRQARQRHI